MHVLYKLSSKVIFNRFKSIMTFIISRMQSVFISDQLIIDNIMVAYELLHSMKLNKNKRVGAMAIKLDIFKTYDKIELFYLKAVLTSMGFLECWISLIMTCITSV